MTTDKIKEKAYKNVRCINCRSLQKYYYGRAGKEIIKFYCIQNNTDIENDEVADYYCNYWVTNAGLLIFKYENRVKWGFKENKNG